VLLAALATPQVIQAFVRQAMGYIDGLPDKESQVSLIKTLQTVTEGKVRRSSTSTQQQQQQLLFQCCACLLRSGQIFCSCCRQITACRNYATAAALSGAPSCRCIPCCGKRAGFLHAWCSSLSRCRVSLCGLRFGAAADLC
jgi:hypothetical protein